MKPSFQPSPPSRAQAAPTQQAAEPAHISGSSQPEEASSRRPANRVGGQCAEGLLAKRRSPIQASTQFYPDNSVQMHAPELRVDGLSNHQSVTPMNAADSGSVTWQEPGKRVASLLASTPTPSEGLLANDQLLNAPIPETRAIDRKGYLYVPEVGQDSCKSIIGVAARRFANGKEPYTVIVNTDDDRAKLSKSLEAYRSTDGKAIAEAMSAEFSKKGKSSKYRTKMVEAMNGAMGKKITIKTASKLVKIDPLSTKLYIVGHGRGGGGGEGLYYKNGEKKYALLRAEDFAQMLSNGGLSRDYQDIRLLCCHGADHPEDESRTTSTGQKIANALGNAGFRQVMVSAYPGKHLNAPRAFAEGKNNYALHAAVTLNDGSDKPRIASKMRQSFTPKYPPEHEIRSKGSDLSYSSNLSVQPSQSGEPE